MIRRDALQKTIAELIPGSPWEQTVARLRCLRGLDTLSAVGLCAEVGDFERFAKAGQLMSYVGLTPSEDTSGEKDGQPAHIIEISWQAQRRLHNVWQRLDTQRRTIVAVAVARELTGFCWALANAD